jgi:hypothetical protein
MTKPDDFVDSNDKRVDLRQAVFNWLIRRTRETRLQSTW